jgi:hypothetical protein
MSAPSPVFLPTPDMLPRRSVTTRCGMNEHEVPRFMPVAPVVLRSALKLGSVLGYGRHPGVTAIVVDRLRRRGECGIGKRAHSNGNCIGLTLRLPKYCRAATGAKMKVHRKPTIGAPSISSKVPIRFNVLTRKKCGYAIRAACSPLAI